MHCVGDIAHMGKNALLIQWLGRLWCSFLYVLFFFVFFLFIYYKTMDRRDFFFSIISPGRLPFRISWNFHGLTFPWIFLKKSKVMIANIWKFCQRLPFKYNFWPKTWNMHLHYLFRLTLPWVFSKKSKVMLGNISKNYLGFFQKAWGNDIRQIQHMDLLDFITSSFSKKPEVMKSNISRHPGPLDSPRRPLGSPHRDPDRGNQKTKKFTTVHRFIINKLKKNSKKEQNI